jgi:membrane protein
MAKYKERLSSFKQLVEVDIWKTKLSALPKTKSLVYHNLRIVIITFHDFVRDKCGIKASALTYLSILSIVPVIATLFGIAKGFGLEINLQEQLKEFFSGQEMVMDETFKYAQRMLDNAKGGVIASFSIGFLIFTVLTLFHNIEIAFNDIWDIKKQRSIIRKVTDYTSILVVAPLIFVIASSMTVVLNTQLDELVLKYELFDYAVTMLKLGLRIVPLLLICFMFTMFFLIMPYTKVRLLSAAWAGLLTGIIYHFVQYGYIEFQIGVSRYNAIYGSFAAVPLFFIWVQLSWIIVLFGAEFAFAHQNATRYNLKSDKLSLSYALRKKLALLVMMVITKNFEKGEKALEDSQIADKLGVPVRFILLIIQDLKDAELLLETELPNDNIGYLPAIDIHKITIQFVFQKLELFGLNDISIEPCDQVTALENSIEALSKSATDAPENVLLFKL